MAEQLGAFLTAPRCNSKHQRYRRFARVGSGANQLTAFLAQQATRLSSTSTIIFGKLVKNTAARIVVAPNTGSLA